jgi:tripartite-type tricarboxylate transporter receptor subunit TctC
MVMRLFLLSAVRLLLALRRLLLLPAAGLLLALWPAAIPAQSYPFKAIRLIVPFPPGGPTDLIARELGAKLSEALRQPVIVENKAGAAGNLGVDLAAKAAPDGYTLAIVPAGNIAVNPMLYPKLPYKSSDLAPVSMLATVENVLVVPPDLPVRSMQDLVALARAKPGKLSFASPGAGSQAHLAGELIGMMAGIDLLHVPYKGVGPALNDLLGGQVSLMVAQLPSALPQIRAGKLRALGVASAKRAAVLPEVPTIAEQGFPGFEAVSWYALMAPAGTPPAVVSILSGQCIRILKLADVADKLSALGAAAAGSTPDELAATIRAETARWAAVISARGITVD